MTQERVSRAAFERVRDNRDDLGRQLHEAREALDYLLEAVRYVREPHHLDHAKECSLCRVATDMLDGAAEKARSALAHKPEAA